MACFPDDVRRDTMEVEVDTKSRKHTEDSTALGSATYMGGFHHKSQHITTCVVRTPKQVPLNLEGFHEGVARSSNLALPRLHKIFLPHDVWRVHEWL